MLGSQGFVFTEGDKYQKYQNVVYKGIRDTYEITLGSGLKIQATNDHKFMTDKGWLELKDLKIGEHNILINDSLNIIAVNEYDQEYEMYGWMHGDGWFNETVGISFNNKDGDFDVKERLLPEFHKQFETHNLKPLKDDEVSYQFQTERESVIQKCKELGFVQCRACDKELPTTFYSWTMLQQISFIRGLLTADGFVYGNTGKQINLSSTSKVLIEQVQKFLASIGIQSRVYTAEFKTCKRKPQHKLAIANQSAIDYYRIFGFSGSTKTEKFSNDTFNVRKKQTKDCIRSIEYVGKNEVFDIVEVDQTNSFYANGILVHNCNLGSINLYNMVKNPFTKDAAIDWLKFEQTVQLGIKALDEILDYGLGMQPLPENKQAVIDWRAIGLGLFGVADALIALGIRYGSDESIAVIENVMNRMFESALLTSAFLAKDKGTFKRYNWEYVKESPLLKMLEGTWIYNKVKQYGLRNGSLLSIAPTGSIATMCGLSGGVEPLYAISYERTTHALEKQKKNFKVYAKSVEHLLKTVPETVLYEEQWIKQEYPFIVTSHDINPLDRIKVQAAMQQYVDNAISSTVNLKNESTVDDVYQTYMTAWKSGCKGITIFRDGCARTSILGKETKEEPKETSSVKFNSVSPIKRGNLKRINGSTMVGHTACVKNLYTTVNTKDDNVFEVFTNVSSGCKSNINTITRLVSLALRSGVKVEEVIHELKANVCPACSVLKQQGKTEVSGSCGTCIAEAIEEVYQMKESVESTLAKCPECGKNGLVPTGKCVSCSNCGYSKCD